VRINLQEAGQPPYYKFQGKILNVEKAMQHRIYESEEIKNKILKNMSGRAAEMMLEDLNSKGPVRLSEVEKQQKEILIIIRRLADEGQITISSGGDDDFV